MASIIENANFLENENYIFSFFKSWNMNLNFAFSFFCKYDFECQFEFQLKLKQNLNSWEMAVTSKSFCLIGRCLYCLTITLWQIRWIVLEKSNWLKCLNKILRINRSVMNEKKEISIPFIKLFLQQNWYIFMYQGNQHSNKLKYLYSEDVNKTPRRNPP